MEKTKTNHSKSDGMILKKNKRPDIDEEDLIKSFLLRKYLALQSMDDIDEEYENFKKRANRSGAKSSTQKLKEIFALNRQKTLKLSSFNTLTQQPKKNKIGS